MKLLALDPATKTGWAHSDGPSGVWELNVRRDESGGMRLIRFRAKLDEIFAALGVYLVVFESVSYTGRKMQGASFQSELVGTLKVWCESMGDPINYVGYNLATIKKHALPFQKKRNKEAMVAAAKDKWPDKDIVDDNEADALWLLDLAKTELAPDGQQPLHHGAAFGREP